jgi:hypothetical protein
MNKYVSPEFKLKAFNCPHCNAFSNMRWEVMGSNFGSFGLYLSKCVHCEIVCLWKGTARDENGYTDGVLIIPDNSTAPLPHVDMPESVKLDYLEARGIANSSPRGSAALLRLAVQKLCIELGETSGNINTDIGSLVSKGLPIGIQRALDVVRVVGNNAVHPGELSVDDIAEVSISLFELINAIVEDRIARPKALDALYLRLPQGARDAVEKRDK